MPVTPLGGSDRPLEATLAAEALTETVASNIEPLALALTAAASESAEAENAVNIGDVVGFRYELLAKLGAGGMGTVYKAQDHMADEVVAIKFLAQDLAERPEIAERFRRELKAARKIIHPGVVRLYDLGEVGGQMALTMEFIQGETLGDRIERDGPLPRERWIALVQQLTNALAAAHAAGVLHRDIKPANILIRGDTDEGVIADFGVSRIGQTREPDRPDSPVSVAHLDPSLQLTQVGQILGTPLYMAPELLEGAGAATPPSSDVYAMGLLLYEAATGKVPHPARTMEELRTMRRQPPPHVRSIRPDLPDNLASIVDRCVRTNPEQRFNSAVELAAAVESAIRGRPRRIAIAVLSTLLVGLAVWGGFYVWNGMLPRRNRVVWIDTHGAPTEARLGTAIRNMTVRALALNEERFAVADSAADANVTVRIDYERKGQRVIAKPAVGPAGGRLTALRPVEANAVAGAVDILVSGLRDALGGEQLIRAAEAHEKEEMGQLGTTSYAAYREYRIALRELFATAVIDADAVNQRLTKIRELDPLWPHAYALAAVNTGLSSEPAQQAAREGLAATELSSPPSRALLEAIRDSSQGQQARAIQTLDVIFQRNQRDIVVGWLLFTLLDAEHRTDDAIGILSRLHAVRPDLQFGADLAGALRAVGRDNEVEPLLATWLDRWPDAEQAYTLQIVRGLDEADLSQLEQQARELIFMFGEAPHRTAMLCDVLIAAGQTKQAQPLADRLLSDRGVDRVRGLRRLGDIAILQGRFSPALQALQRAVLEGRPYGFNGELAQSLEALRLLSKPFGEEKDVRRYTDELRVYRHELGWTASAVALEYEVDLIERKKCLSPDEYIQRLPEGPAREIAERDALRVASAHGCIPCADAVRAGRAPTERSMVSLFQFADCAEREGEVRLAKDAFETVQRIRTATDSIAIHPSPYHAVLARYRLGELAFRQGDKERARTHFEDFLRFWGEADHPVAEVAVARARLAALASDPPEKN